MRTFPIGSSTMFSSVAIVTVMLLVCGPHVTEAGFEFGAYCYKLCQWGKGGNLCKCSAVHFAGKRNKPERDNSNFPLIPPQDEEETDLYSDMLNELHMENTAKDLPDKMLRGQDPFDRQFAELLGQRSINSELDHQNEERLLRAILKRLVARRASAHLRTDAKEQRPQS